MFVNRELWFSYPSSFNDPFDCSLQLHVKGTNGDILTYLKEWENEPDLKKKAYYDWLKQLDPSNEWKNDGLFNAAFNDRFNKIYNKSSFYCWTKNCESIPMFAYYADGHKGLCAEFEFPDNHEAVKDVFNVECIPNFPELNFLKLVNTEQFVRSLIATKASCWEHEKEWRVFRENKCEGAVKYKDSCLKRIILGVKTSQEHKDMIRSWLSDWKTEVKLARAKPSDKEFKLIIEDFDSIGRKND